MTILIAGTPPPTDSAPAATVPPCLAGQWHSTGLPEQPDSAIAGIHLTGGAGVKVLIRPDGRTDVDFTNMSPVAFTVRLGDASAGGRYRYTGAAAGTMATTVTTDGPSASPGLAGRWRPVGDVVRTMHVAVELDRPTGSGDTGTTPFPDRPREAIDEDPFFDAGRYWCQGDTLIVTPEDGGLPMILHRTMGGTAGDSRVSVRATGPAYW